MWSGHNFAHYMTAELSWHVQICRLIRPFLLRLKQKGFYWDLSYKLIFDCVIDPSSHAAADRLFHSPHAQPWRQAFACLPSGLYKGTVSGVWKTIGIPTDHVSPWCNGALGNPNLYLDQPITKGWCQPIGGHGSYPTDSPIATRQGLYISLPTSSLQHQPQYSEPFIFHSYCPQALRIDTLYINQKFKSDIH